MKSSVRDTVQNGIFLKKIFGLLIICMTSKRIVRTIMVVVGRTVDKSKNKL